MNVTGAVVIVLILGPTAWLVRRGDRTTHAAPPGKQSTPTRIESPAPR